MSHLICVQFPSSGGTCSMLLFCKSNVANMGKFLNPAASIVVILLLSANIISNFFISYNEEGKVVNLSNKCSVLYLVEEFILVRIENSSRMQVQVHIFCPCILLNRRRPNYRLQERTISRISWRDSMSLGKSDSSLFLQWNINMISTLFDIV